LRASTIITSSVALVQKWIFHRLPLAMLLEQIIKGLDRQGV
jgi:hypothetical protein